MSTGYKNINLHILVKNLKAIIDFTEDIREHEVNPLNTDFYVVLSADSLNKQKEYFSDKTKKQEELSLNPPPKKKKKEKEIQERKK